MAASVAGFQHGYKMAASMLASTWIQNGGLHVGFNMDTKCRPPCWLQRVYKMAASMLASTCKQNGGLHVCWLQHGYKMAASVLASTWTQFATEQLLLLGCDLNRLCAPNSAIGFYQISAASSMDAGPFAAAAAANSKGDCT